MIRRLEGWRVRGLAKKPKGIGKTKQTRETKETERRLEG